MRSLMVAAALVFSTCGSLAQGAFSFGNKNLAATPPIDAKVCLANGSCAAGTNYWTQAYIKLANDPDSSYAAVGQAVHFRTGNNAGYIVTQVITTSFPGGTLVNLEMRAWDAELGDSYEEAIAAAGLGLCTCAGRSAAVTLTLTAAPATPADMVGLTSCELPPFGCFIMGGITREPSGSRVAVGSLASLEMQVTRRCSVSIQWHRDNQPVVGATDTTFSIPQANLADTGDYYATLTGPFGHSTTSQVARVVVGYPLSVAVNGPGRIEAQPMYEIFEPGERVTLTAVPSEGATFERWEGDFSGSVNPTALTMDGPKTVQAWFAWMPMLLSISWQQDRARVEWTMPAVLQASDVLAPGDWHDVSDAASPYDVEPANAQRFYRLRRPRRARCGKSGGGARAASGVRRFTGALHRSGNTMLTRVGPSHRSHADWDRLRCQSRSGLNADQVRQANGRRHRSRGQRPRAAPAKVRALKGRTNSLARSYGPGLAWPLQGVEILGGAGSEGDALGYDGGRFSGGGLPKSAANVHVPRHRPWNPARWGIKQAHSTRVVTPGAANEPRAACGVRRLTLRFTRNLGLSRLPSSGSGLSPVRGDMSIAQAAPLSLPFLDSPPSSGGATPWRRHWPSARGQCRSSGARAERKRGPNYIRVAPDGAKPVAQHSNAV